MLILCCFCLLLSSCSFVSDGLEEQQSLYPDMVFTDITLYRYADAHKNISVNAQELEVYDSEKQWAGQGIVFTYFDDQTQEESLKGEAGVLSINEKADEYLFGKTVSFYLLQDDFLIRSSALYWNKKDKLLTAPEGDSVTVMQGKDVHISGQGFSADTAAKTFHFSKGANGTIMVSDSASELSTDPEFL